MAEEQGSGEEKSEEAGSKETKKPLDPQLLFLAGSAALTVAALGTLVYTKLLFKRSPITEEAELQKRVEEGRKPIEAVQRPIVALEQISVNIAMTSGKAHYATVSVAVECRDDAARQLVESKKDFFMDRIIATLGKREITELNTIQGKLLLKTELLRKFNEVSPAAGITDIYFNNFVLQ